MEGARRGASHFTELKVRYWFFTFWKLGTSLCPDFWSKKIVNICK